MPQGYHGCYLRIDVSSGEAECVPLDSRAALSAERLKELVRAYNMARNWTLEGHFIV